MDIVTAAAIEILAEDLHRDYRAAEKALRHLCLDNNLCADLRHDHGWRSCHKKKYFRNRAGRKLKETQ
jgi:hypothetical protein